MTKSLAQLTGLTTALALVAAAAIPAAAGATDYCVQADQACDAYPNTLEAALDLADNATDADRIFLGEGEYKAGSMTGFTYGVKGAAVQIIGAGRERTVLTGQKGGSVGVLSVMGGAGTAISDLTIHLPEGVGPDTSGLNTNAAVRRVTVSEHPAQVADHDGIDLKFGGTLEDSTVRLPTGTGVTFGSGAGGIWDSEVVAKEGVLSAWGGTIQGSRLEAAEPLIAEGGITNLVTSVLRSTGQYAVHAVDARSDATVNIDHVTIWGSGLLGAGVTGFSSATGRTVRIHLRNSIIRNVGGALVAWTSPLGGQVGINASHSDYDPSHNEASIDSTIITETDVTNVGQARFVDPLSGDFRLRPDSPLVDAGDPATGQGLDLEGNPLVADGNGDGVARRDLGAYELQPTASTPTQSLPAPPSADELAPALSGLKVAPSVIARGRALPALTSSTRKPRIELTVSERAKLTFRFTRRVRGAWKPVRGQITIPASRVSAGKLGVRFAGRLSATRRLAPGAYRVQAVATDLAGNRSKPATARFRLRR